VEQLISDVIYEDGGSGPDVHAARLTRLYLLNHGEKPPEGHGVWLRIGLEMPASAAGYAAVLYDTLHRLDAQRLDWIAVERPPETPEWAGVLDRLRRAAG
jgi:L-threonylcarbamoyladenylate synthase